MTNFARKGHNEATLVVYGLTASPTPTVQTFRRYRPRNQRAFRLKKKNLKVDIKSLKHGLAS